MSTSKMPQWVESLRDRYLAGEASLFLLHGNVRDLMPWTDEQGKTEYVDLRGFLERFLRRTRDLVAYYNVSQGLCFADKAQERLFRQSVDARRMLAGQPKLDELPRDPNEAIPVIEDVITDASRSTAVVLDFFEMIAPNGDLSFMGTEEKANLVTLQRWSSDAALLGTDNLVILITEHLTDVSRRLLGSPQLAALQLPFPDEPARQAFIDHSLTAGVTLEMKREVLGQATAGLSLVQIRALLRGAELAKLPVTFRMVSQRKKQIIEQECHGLVELVTPEHNFSVVGGMEGVKRELMRVAEAVKDGHRNRVPMGMIFVGPMGTGKTFVAEAFAAESGLTCLKLMNFRDKWVGSTEANLEKVLGLVEALGYVLLIIDEADRSLSSGAGSDGGVNSRVIARLKEFMSDTDHRGRVVILMMTNRPDKLDVDLKRPGRFDVKIPFFFPETVDEREKIFRALIRKNKVAVDPEISVDEAVLATEGFSAAELESVVLTATNLAAEEGAERVSSDVLGRAARDVIPSRDSRMLGYMELLAVFECSAKRMLPARYVSLGTEEVQQNLDLLRIQLGGRL